MTRKGMGSLKIDSLDKRMNYTISLDISPIKAASILVYYYTNHSKRLSLSSI